MNKFEQELSDLEGFFKTAQLPAEPCELNKYMKVYDIKLLIMSEAQKIRRYEGSDLVKDSLFRHLRELKKTIENK